MRPPPRDTDGEVSQEELRKLRRWHSFFRAEHRLAAYLFRLLFFDRGVSRSLEGWLEAKKSAAGLPVDESVRLLFSIFRRISMFALAGFFGFLITHVIMLWQNSLTSEQNNLLLEQNRLIAEQNRYYQISTEELRRQTALQERRELFAVAYDTQRPMRTRVEAVKDMIYLERSLLDLSDSKIINLEGIDLGCPRHGATECANLRGAPLARVDFTGANLRGARLNAADLQESIFLSADLSEADLEDANLRGARFRDDVSRIMTLSLERLAARLENRVGLAKNDAVGAAINLMAFVNSFQQDLDVADSSRTLTLMASIKSSQEGLNAADSSRFLEEAKRHLDAATYASTVDNANWGASFGATKIDDKTRLPFRLDSAPRIYEP